MAAPGRKTGRKSLPSLLSGTPTSQRHQLAAMPTQEPYAHDLDLFYIRQIASHMKVMPVLDRSAVQPSAAHRRILPHSIQFLCFAFGSSHTWPAIHRLSIGLGFGLPFARFDRAGRRAHLLPSPFDFGRRCCWALAREQVSTGPDRATIDRRT